MGQNKSAYGSLELSSDDLLFILSCIESSQRQDLKELGRKALYVRLVQRYVSLVSDGIESLPVTQRGTLELVN
jgi:hypothetical protein